MQLPIRGSVLLLHFAAPFLPVEIICEAYSISSAAHLEKPIPVLQPFLSPFLIFNHLHSPPWFSIATRFFIPSLSSFHFPSVASVTIHRLPSPAPKLTPIKLGIIVSPFFFLSFFLLFLSSFLKKPLSSSPPLSSLLRNKRKQAQKRPLFCLISLLYITLQHITLL